DPVADSVMGYILAFARQIPWMDRQMKGGAWDKKPGRALNETTLGIIGVGRIGKAVVHRAQAFGMRVVGNDTATMPPEFLEETGLEMVTKEKLLCQADFVTLTCDLNPTSHHLMDRGAFALMKPNAVLVNTARGQIVDEHALVESLLEGKIGGAGLDVFEDEPLPSQSPLRQMDNVLLAPHNSNSSPRAWTRVHERTLSNLFEVLEGAAK
ncbi:MAG: dihydrofolate reductase, partial [Deltaproteobacteria bacterium]